MNRKHAQFSFEYILVIAIIFAVFLPFTYVFMGQSSELEEETTRVQLELLSQKIMKYGEELYYAGGYSKRTLKATLPERVTSFSIVGKEYQEIVFKVRTPNGEEDIVYFSKVPIYMPFPITAANEQVYNMHTIYMARRSTDKLEDLKKTVVLCTNLDQTGDCEGIAASAVEE